MMYSLYSLPNIFFPLFGGYFTDKFGSEKLLMFSASFTVAG